MRYDLANGIAVLERTPGVVQAFLGGLPPDWTSPNEGPDTWSPAQVVGHLVDNEESNWMVRARVILAQGASRRFTPVDRTRQVDIYKGRPLAELLARFAEVRQRNLQDLRALELSPAQLALTGEHPEFGTVTLAQLLATWVTHDLGHIAQIARVMAKQYKEAVGPWEAYLPVLRR